MMNRAGKGGDGEDGFEGVKVICYDSADWVRKNFKAKVDKHNEVGFWLFAKTVGMYHAPRTVSSTMVHFTCVKRLALGG